LFWHDDYAPLDLRDKIFLCGLLILAEVLQLTSAVLVGMWLMS
jgi:hypothetical protein